MRNLVLSCLESRVENNRSLYARFLLAPFQNGTALTVGTALRRALLSQIEGIVITALDIQGVTHEFCTIVGVRESVLELSFNFQQIVLTSQVDFKNTQIGYLQVQGPAVVYANDLKLPFGVECVDPTQYIATLSRDGVLVVKFLIDKRINNIHVKKNNSLLTVTDIREAKRTFQKENSKQNNLYDISSKQVQLQSIHKLFQSNVCLQNIIPLDSFCNPVNRAHFTTQVDDLSNQTRERLLFEIWTNGSIHPRQALQSAILSLITLFSEFRTLIHLDSHSLGIHTVSIEQIQTALRKRNSFLYKSNLDIKGLLSSDISNLPLSLKTYICLKQKGIDKVDTLLKYSSKGILQLVNGNIHMFSDIKRCVCTLGLQFARDISQPNSTRL